MPKPIPSERIARRLLIHGKVQGVYYRASAQVEAQRLDLSGWVRNRRSGSVEALVCGPVPRVEAFIEWAHEGSPAARVDHVEICEADPSEAGAFSVRPTE